MTIGANIKHPEWIDRTLGTAAYAGDIAEQDALVARSLRSPHPHAEIVAVDVSEAERVEGVAAIVTARDLPDRRYRDYGSGDRAPIASNVALYYGQEVAVVAAQTVEEAERALSLIRVRYRTLPAATSLEAATRAGAPKVHPETAPDNIATRANRYFGDSAALGQGGAFSVRAEYECGIQAHACMEPQSVLAKWDASDGVLNIWTPTQSARSIQSEIAWMLDLEMDKVRLHRVAVGGDFGSRVKASDIEVLTAALSIKSGRAVRMVMSRAEEFAFTKRQHECRISLETGADASGKLRYRAGEVTVENGAYIHGGSNMMNYCSILLGSQYRLDGAHIRGRSVYTHRRPGGAFRGAGGPQAVFAIESQMDELAAELDIDPIDLRLRNLHHQDDSTITGWEIESTGAAECLETVRERLNWAETRQNGGAGRGVGVALAMHVSGAIVNPNTGRAEATVEIGHNGGVVLSSGCSDPGTGEAALIAQICASELGMDADAIDIRTMDTATTPFDPGAGSSRGTMITGGAVRTASREMAETLRIAAAGRFGTAPDAVSIANGFAYWGSERISIGDLASEHPDAVDGVLCVHLEQIVDNPVVPMTADDDGIGNLSPAYSFAAHGVEVEVDHDTGAVRVLRVVAAHDAGTIINPTGARSQVIGGVVMGMGAAIGEQLVYLDGRPITTSYLDYAMPRASEAPPIDVVFVGEGSRKGPYGSKSIAEIALMPTAPAIANAVAHATGQRVRSLPISPDKVVADTRRAQQRVKPRTIAMRPARWWPALVRRAYPLGLHGLLHRWGPSSSNRVETGGCDIEEVRQPSTSDEALEVINDLSDARPTGGATDILALREQGFGAPRTVVSTLQCEDMKEIVENEDGDLVIGGAVSLASLIAVLDEYALPGDRALAATVQVIATPQIREMATVAGNLCQAKRCWFFRGGFDCYKRGGFGRPCYAVTGDHRYFHAVIDGGRCQAVTPSDLATTLTALDASVDVRLPRTGRRLVPIQEFYSGPGETILGAGDLVHSIVIPQRSRRRATCFRKFSLTGDGFAVASACASLDFADDGSLECRAVLGGVSGRPYRARRTEAAMRRGAHAAEHVDAAARAWGRDAHPLRDNAWKVDAASALLSRALWEARQDLFARDANGERREGTLS